MEQIKIRFLIVISFVILLTTLTASTRSQSCDEEKVEIICDVVKIYDYYAVGEFLTCTSGKSLIVSTSDASVSSVVHKNKTEITNIADIEGLWINEAKGVKFIPSGIKQKFSNLKLLEIDSCGLLSVTKENLKEFRVYLELLSLYNNKITSIDADLFEYNTNLKYIDLSFNPLRFIAPEFFVNLKKLKNIEYVLFNSAGCINQDFTTSEGHQMSTFTWKSENCTDVTAKTATANLIKEEKLKCLEENVARLKAQISEYHKKSAEKLEVKFETLTDALEDAIFSLAAGLVDVENYEQLINSTEISSYLKFLQ